jgi:hypothetical protein
VDEWLVAQALGDATAIEETTRRLPARFGAAVSIAITVGLPLATWSVYWRLACGHDPSLMLTRALVDSGYTEVAARYAASMPDTASSMELLCTTELWRVASGDTSRSRAVVDHIVHSTRDRESVGPRIGPSGHLCVEAIEAGIEAQDPGATSRPALARLDALHRQGTGNKLPAGINVALARWLEASGDLPAAVAAVRRRTNAWTEGFQDAKPASLREEGRLAALVGDTAGAIAAYEQYLELRDQPEPGSLQHEVATVRAELAALKAKRR